MHVAFRERDNACKTHRRADGDDEGCIRHRLIKLLKCNHRFERKQRHQNTRGEQD